MPTYLRWFNVVFVITVLVAGPVAYKMYREEQSRAFRVVQPGVLYRSGQLPVEGLRRLVHDYRIRTVISLRDSGSEEDQAEVEYCRTWGIKHVRIPPRAWWSSEGRPPAEIGLRAFRDVMNNPANHPVLIHCYAGVHRTGAYCAVYRMDFQGWSNEKALKELRELGYTNLDDEWDVLTYLENYKPGKKNLTRAVSRQR